MADRTIVDRAIKKLSDEEYLHLRDYLISAIKREERTDYAKGYNAGRKKFLKGEDQE